MYNGSIIFLGIDSKISESRYSMNESTVLQDNDGFLSFMLLFCEIFTYIRLRCAKCAKYVASILGNLLFFKSLQLK